jgi:hypothetical protein
MQLAYGETARLCTRYWNTPKGADGRYVAAWSSAETDSGFVAGVNCLWQSNSHEHQIAGMLVTDDRYVGFFDLPDVKASDLNDGNPAYASLDYLVDVTLHADPLIDTEGYKRIAVVRATRNILIEFTLENGTKWKCEIARELLYGQDGVSHRKLLNDFLSALDAAWTAVAPAAPQEGQKRFQKLVVGEAGLSFAEQLDTASRRAEKKLKSAVEKAGYIWNKNDGEYFLFSTGENLSGYELSEKALGVLAAQPLGTGCALAVVTARKS